MAISVAAFKLSGAQVSTVPTSSFPPTGMGMLTAPLWWAQMSLGDMLQECQAGAPSALGNGSHMSILAGWLLQERHRTR